MNHAEKARISSVQDTIVRSLWWAHFTRKWAFEGMPCSWHRLSARHGRYAGDRGAVTGMFLVAGMLKGYDDPADYDGKPTMPASGNWRNSSGRNTIPWSVGSCCRRCPAS
ncbi:MAG: hypothetical protein ACLVK8_02560 [Ruminococcus sp.]